MVLIVSYIGKYTSAKLMLLWQACRRPKQPDSSWLKYEDFFCQPFIYKLLLLDYHNDQLIVNISVPSLMNPDQGKSLKEIRWCWCIWWCNPESPSALTQTSRERKTDHSPVIYLILHFQSDNCLVYFYTFLWWIFYGIF